MIILIILFIFIIYFWCKVDKRESFLDRKKSKLTNCSYLTNNINNHFEVFKQRHNAYSHQKHKEHGIMRPILFYFWDHSIPSSTNFKENQFVTTELSNCPNTIQEELKYYTGSIENENNIGQTPYGKVRNNLKNLKLPLKNGNSIFKSDQLYPDDIKKSNREEFYIFRQTYPDFHGNEISKEFKFKPDIDEQEMEKSTSYHNKNSDSNLRILDFDLGCYAHTNDTLNICPNQDYKINSIKDDVENSTACCYLDKDSYTNNGIIIANNKDSSTQCCKNIIALEFIPESQLIMKFIFYAKNEFLQNLTYYGYNDYNINKLIITNTSSYKEDLNKKGIVSNNPEFILWDGFGVYVKKDENNKFYIYIINEDDNQKPFNNEYSPENKSGIDLKIEITNDNNDKFNFEYYSKSPIFKNFIKNHFYVYRKNGLNFFEYMSLEFKKLAFNTPSKKDYIEIGSKNKFLVKDNELTEYGLETVRELYKYHVKSDNNFNSIEGSVPLYKDIHINYFTLTKWYGNNNCLYFKYKQMYEMENIDYNWNVCDIMKFILNTLYLPYKIMDPTNGCYTEEGLCWGDELISHYNDLENFNCKSMN